MSTPILTPSAEALAQTICAAIGAHEKDDLISALVSILAAAIVDHPDCEGPSDAEIMADCICDALMDVVVAGAGGKLAHGSLQ
ncbi:hypothetical protein [Rhizobium sp. G21]|uniref:hypothetical protein n=1 Tax=Rhizobium sp. G21 TaxID=2758439 RepID=UPI0016020A67|nr:hypothetical protein [Rhizobium sp. G21]MBB1247428.1 hypothetical protein [Rhizobium sp. G21]